MVPPDDAAPRYTRKAFPTYRFLPGQSPHPTEDPQGHSFDIPEDHIEFLTEENWRTHQSYLYGIDLYNAAYWWEAHENFERLWRLYPKGEKPGSFCKD